MWLWINYLNEEHFPLRWDGNEDETALKRHTHTDIKIAGFFRHLLISENNNEKNPNVKISGENIIVQTTCFEQNKTE